MFTVFFEVGSIISAAAPTSIVFIIGRVVSGMGGIGIGPGAFLLITHLVPLHKQPKFMGSLQSMFDISSNFGPILGGYLTSIGWRWCFWINGRVGGIAMILLLLLTPETHSASKPAKWWRKGSSTSTRLGSSWSHRPLAVFSLLSSLAEMTKVDHRFVWLSYLFSLRCFACSHNLSDVA